MLKRLWPRHIAIPLAVFVISSALAIASVLTFPPLRQPAPTRIVHAVPKKVNVTPARKVAAKPAPKSLSDFEKEQRMSFSQLMNRWQPLIDEAAKRYNVPAAWIRAVIQVESGGKTMLSQTKPMISSMGAMGLMQLMPETYNDMRRDSRLGTNPYDPHDNIMAGAAYLRFLRGKYGYPQMFTAYNDGPGNLEARLMGRGLLPVEAQNYAGNVVAAMEGVRGGHGVKVKFTRPNGEAVMIDSAMVSSVRAAFPGEYAPGVLSVITTGRIHQGVRESLASAKAMIRAHGGGV